MYNLFVSGEHPKQHNLPFIMKSLKSKMTRYGALRVVHAILHYSPKFHTYHLSSLEVWFEK